MSKSTPQKTTNGSHELAYRLKTCIDQDGQYSRALNDMAAGYAAGKGIRHMIAKREINTSFQDEFHCSPYDYLDSVRKENANGMANNAPAKEPHGLEM